MIRFYTEIERGKSWAAKYRGCLPIFACILGFTETGLISGISAAGRTPEDRKYTACADAEFLYYGAEHQASYPLPPLEAGASPVFISRAVVESLNIPLYIFNAGLPQPPAVPAIDLGGSPAKCLSLGAAMEIQTVQHLFEEGLIWGERLAANLKNLNSKDSYLILSECVVGGTTTALATLTGLGIPAKGLVNSSHPVCNHSQKWEVVRSGLEKISQGPVELATDNYSFLSPLTLLAGVGDPMQPVVAGMAIAASRSCGVMLAGGTQMLAVFALTSYLARAYTLDWRPSEIVVGTTRWVAEDATGGTVELAKLIGKSINSENTNRGGISVPLVATSLNLTESCYPQLQAYERGFVKEGVGAGAACIAANLIDDWQQAQLCEAVENQLQRVLSLNY